ncbi:hypothetical protein [Streptomyces sp. NPDC056190]
MRKQPGQRQLGHREYGLPPGQGAARLRARLDHTRAITVYAVRAET